MLRIILLAAIFIFLATDKSFAQTIQYRNNVNVESGKYDEVLVLKSWHDETCKELPFTSHEIQQPSHGIIEKIIEAGTIGGGADEESLEGPFGKCFGKTTPETIFIYTPEENFVGSDELVVRSERKGDDAILSVVIITVE